MEKQELSQERYRMRIMSCPDRKLDHAMSLPSHEQDACGQQVAFRARVCPASLPTRASRSRVRRESTSRSLAATYRLLETGAFRISRSAEAGLRAALLFAYS